MNRWLILFGYMLLTACTQLVWLSFAPITDASARDLHTSIGNIGTLSALFAGVYVLLALPAGRWLDARFGQALAFGAICNALGAGVRVLAPNNYTAQLLGQVILAVGQPFVVNAITGIATRYFPHDERPKAIAAGSASMFLGVLLASLTAPALYELGKLPLVLLGHALPMFIGAVWVLLALRTPPTQPPALAVTAGTVSWLPKDSLIWKLGLLLFTGFGVFSALSTWLEALLSKVGITPTTSGLLLGGMVVAGVLGSLTLPVLAARLNRRKQFLMASSGVAMGTLLALTGQSNVAWLGICLALGGFFQLAGLPMTLEWAEEHVPSDHQGATVGFLMLAGNLGTLTLVLLTELVIHRAAIWTLGALALTCLLGLLVASTLPRRESGLLQA